jgi:FtsP/CotA-like multicopper oxidase with cupredoxin domain
MDPAATGGTLLRGYVQEVNGVALGEPHYLGPLIIAMTNRPVRIKFTNRLPVGAAGDLFVPVDTTIMGAGDGPTTNTFTGLPYQYTQNRATLHLHGGFPPWISDGTAHQWTVPAAETTPSADYKKGASAQSVPDMGLPTDGSITFYWPNQQGGRLMFYHDHAFGITGPNVYAGEAAGYLLVDPSEDNALAAIGVPGTLGSTPDLAHLIPLIIQDKTFVPDLTTLNATDPLWLDSANTWRGGTPPAMGNLWFPHVYVPNQWPDNPDWSGANPYGRWDYGPWFWPPWPVLPGSTPPIVSHVPESFMDTPVVNGMPYPYVDVQPQAYRLRILNACNDRMINLQFYQAEPITVSITNSGANYTLPPIVTIAAPAGGGAQALATSTILGGEVISITVTNAGSGYAVNERPAVTLALAPGDITGAGAGALASVLSDVKMVQANRPQALWPTNWGTADSRVGGWPDPTLRGPAMIQIGTEGGLLPGPVLLLNTPIDYEYNRRNIVVLNVLEKTLFLAAAERADVIVDFSPYAGKTIILYNDAPAPVPASDPRYDFYTGDPDFSATGGANDQGGAPSTLPGMGPNTRTIIQFRVAGTDSGTPGPIDAYATNILVALTNQTTGLPAIFKATQPVPIVPEAAYNAMAYTGGATTNKYARIQDYSLTFIPYGSTTPMTMFMRSKAIQELFDPLGRMNATLGVELPFTSALIQTTIPLGFADPATEIFDDGETQMWKITHNGVDTHGVHFHLFNVQVINRVGWDGAIRAPDPNELGWKETVRMNPLEDIIVAARASTPTNIPFAVPDSVRPLNPALPLGSLVGFTQVDPLTGNPMVVSNVVANFGWEYTWHCHLLGHEENDMMRPLIMRVTQILPVAASDLTAVLVGPPLQVNLAWTNNANNVSGFRIQRATDPGFTTALTTFTIGPSPLGALVTYSDTPVAGGTTYYYRVIAYNAAGDALSPPTTSITTPTVPAAPTGLTATVTPYATTVLLAWTDNSANETGFTVEKATNPGFTGALTFILPAGTIGYTDSAVVAGTRYYYRVSAFNAAGRSGYSAASVLPTAPTAPSNLTGSPASPTTSVILSWNDNSNNEQGFYVWRSANGGTTWTKIATTAANSSSYRNTGLAHPFTYLYRVQAFNAWGLSAFTATLTVTTH